MTRMFGSDVGRAVVDAVVTTVAAGGASMRSTHFPVSATVARSVLSAFPDVSDAICVVCVPTVPDSPDTDDAEDAASAAACVAAVCAVCAAEDAADAEVAAACAVDSALLTDAAVDAAPFCKAVIAVSA